VLSATANAVTWANVYQKPSTPSDDPYFHVRVFEKKKGTDPWFYKLVARHLVVTPEALEKSRTGEKAKTYSYNDAEFRYLYRDWLKSSATRSNTPIVIRHGLRALTHRRCGYSQRAPTTRARSRSILARPYICRLMNLSLVIWPSVWPLEWSASQIQLWTLVAVAAVFVGVHWLHLHLLAKWPKR
jgi:hypothetical protein